MSGLPHIFTRSIVSRRAALAQAAPFFAWMFAPHASAASGQRGEDQRLLVIVLRGGMDGLAAVAAPGDPAFAAARATNAKQQQELHDNILPLDDTFALNGHLSTLHALYRRGEALIVHAVASPSRTRSHFEAQDVLESGLPTASSNAPSGWLNRALTLMPRGPALRAPPSGLAVAATMPLIMRGPAPIVSWQPQTFESADPDTIRRVHDLYAQEDAALADALVRGVAMDEVLGSRAPHLDGAPRGGKIVAESVNAVTSMMVRPDGPRIATMNIDGWDTHIDQGFEHGAAGRQMTLLDYVVAQISARMAPVWRSTVVAIVTEFGRTVRINGSAGTDHGTATIALLIGGALNGGRVLADWPGLGASQLFEGRDLMPTMDLRGILKGILAEHVGVPLRAMADQVFPQSSTVAPVMGLVKT